MNADVLLQAALTEGGNPRALRLALETYWAPAQVRLARLRTAQDAVVLGATADSDRERLGFLHDRVEGLGEDMLAQRRVSDSAFGGRFPLAWVLANGPRIGSGGSHFVLVGDPETAAAADAARTLAADMLTAWDRYAAINVVVVGPGGAFDDKAVGRVVRELGAFPRLMIRRGVDVANASSATNFSDALREEELPIWMRTWLLEKFGPDPVLLVRVAPTDAVIDVRRVILRASLIAQNEGTAQPVISARLESEGLRRDGRGRALPVGLLVGALLLTAAAAGWLACEPRARGDKCAWGRCVLAVLAFAIGGAGVWGGLHVLAPALPSTGGVWIAGLWWPAVSGLAWFVVPPVVAERAIPRLIRMLSPPAASGPGAFGAGLGVACGLGATGALTPPALLWGGTGGAWLTAALAPGAAALGALAATAQSRHERVGVGWLVPASALAALLGMMWMTGVVAPVAWVSVSTVALAAWVLRRARFHRPHVAVGMEPTVDAAAASDTSRLATTVDRPRIVPTPVIEETSDALRLAAEGICTWTLIRGPSGTGKTRAVEQAVRSLTAEHGVTPWVLHLRGDPSRREMPYAAVGPSLSQLLGFSVGNHADRVSNGLQAAVGSAVGLLVPFGNLLAGETDAVESPAEIHRAVAAALARQTTADRSGPVARPMVWICDDVQRFDDASAELVAALVEHLPPGSTHCLAVVVCVTNAGAVAAAGRTFDALAKHDGVRVIETARWTPAMSQRLLVEGVGLTPQCAERVVDHARSHDAGLHAPLELTRHLVDTGRLVQTSGGLDLDEVLRGGPLPAPGALIEQVRHRLGQHAQHRLTLEAAAVLGHEFSVRELASVLGVSRLTLIHQLRELEHEAGLVVDLRDRDDAYRFGSQLCYDLLTTELDLAEDERFGDERPQLVRELHTRIAEVLASRPHPGPNDTYRLARHSFLAGPSQAAVALQWNRRAAVTATRQSAFDAARRCLDRAQQAATSIGSNFDAASERLLLDCEAAHVTGEGVAGAARRALDHVANGEDTSPTMWVVTLRAAWECGRFYDDPDASEVFARGVALLHDVCRDNARSTAIRAEALHLLGRVKLEDHATLAAGRALLEESLALVEDDHHTDRPDDQEQAAACEDPPAASVERFMARLLDPRHTRGRVINSLANHLLHGSPDDRAAARRLIDRGIALRGEALKWDRKGLGIALSVRGRLHLAASPPDLDAAAHDFDANAMISDSIGDRYGMTFMQSQLALVRLMQGDAHSAKLHAQAALETVGDRPMGLFFALCRHIRAAAADGAVDAASDSATKLVAALAEGMRVYDLSEFEAARKACQQAGIVVQWRGSLEPSPHVTSDI